MPEGDTVWMTPGGSLDMKQPRLLFWGKHRAHPAPAPASAPCYLLTH